jgi:hypothetical protein
MPITPQKLAKILLITRGAARLLLDGRPGLDETELREALKKAEPLADAQRAWVWEIHKQCDQLLHQRLASFTAAQAMTLAAFTLLTVARFNADPVRIAQERIHLLDISRLIVIVFGGFLAVASSLVTYSMFRRLNYLNRRFLFRDEIYDAYFYSIGWMVPFYRYIIPVGLPVAEFGLWALLLYLLRQGILADVSLPAVTY